jgi:RNA-directed DNA polymerase
MRPGGYNRRIRRQAPAISILTAFLPALSRDKLVDKGREVRRWRLHRRTGDTLADLAQAINPIVRGWMGYWGHF